MKRPRRGAAVLAIVALATVATIAFAPAAGATFPGRNGLIAFQAETEQGLQIFTVRANGHQLHQITHVDGAAALPDWSPDGRRIAFTLNECSVAIMDADGGDLSVLAEDPGLCQGDASFTPDGSRLVYTRFDVALEVEQIWSMDVDGSDKRFITDPGGPDPNVSPDGRKTSFKGPPDGALFVANIDGSGIVQISPSISVTYKHDWSPDGQHLVVSDNSEPAPDEAVNIVTVRPDGSDWTYLTHYPAGFRANVGGYSPDGQWIVFRLEGPGLVPTMYRIRPDGSDLHKIFQSSTIVPRFIDWGPAARH
ncbi:WD40 repeat protein [Micromonospora kangleipakensis]|uniref:WD40 repeat protein n=1 Tax=Micromonospora kangleipakensis TaxID=1077942 RepID=A0A4V2GD91_9ACTN|nr:WD40 repeat protein [Micromonospora kangleipakensis]